MSEVEKYNNGVQNFIIAINSKFEGNNSENESIDKEVEFKVSVAGFSKQSDFDNLQNEILKELGGEILFDGVIKDKRYCDINNKEKSELKKNGISVVRIREQTDFKNYKKTKNKNDINKNYVYTVKKYDENGYSDELEDKNIENDFGEKVLKGEYGLEEIEISKKKRKELKFFVKIDGVQQEVKIAFDKYFDSDNREIEGYFEVEAKTEEAAKKGLEKLLKLESIKDKKVKITFGGKRKIKEEYKREKLIENFNGILENFNDKEKKRKSEFLIENVVESIVNLLESKSIYISVDELLKNIETNTNYLYNDELKDNLKILLERNLDILVRKNDIFKRFFYRIITNNNPKNDPKKKFFDKFEREYSGYIKSFLNVVVGDFEKKLSENSDVDKVGLITDIIKNRLDVFLKSLFLFNDSLTKEDLEKILELDSNKIDLEFGNFVKNISLIYNEDETGKVPEIWENNERILDRLVTSYSRSYASVVQKGKELGDKKAIENKQETIEKEQFSFLAKKFSQWLNSPNRELSTFDTIKNLLKEDFYHIFLLAEKGLAFQELKADKFDQDFVNRILGNFENVLFNKKNFQVEEKGPELFKIFVENLFSESDFVRENIIEKFKEYNVKHNLDIKKTNKKDNLDLVNIIEKDINFDLFQDLKNGPRLYLFINKILDIKGNKGITIKNYFFSSLKKGQLKKNFIEYEFEKRFKEKKYTKDFIDFLEKNKINENSKRAQTFEQKKYTKDYSNGLKSYKTYINSKLKFVEKFLEKNNNISSLNNYEIVKYLTDEDIEAFQILVSWFQFILKSKRQGSNVKDLSLYSESFMESILNNIGDDIINGNSEMEFMTSTSSAYNTSVLTDERIIEFHDRIGNDKSIDASENFIVEMDGESYFLKDFNVLYLDDIRNTNYERNRFFLENGIKTVRDLLNGDKVSKNDTYLNILKNINFPIDDSKSLKKLLEFQKFVYKMIIPVINELNATSELQADILYRGIYNYIGKDVGYEKQNNFKPAVPKSYARTTEKVVSKHGGVIEKIADGNRISVFGDSLFDLSNNISDFIKWLNTQGGIKSCRLEDKIGNIFKEATRLNGYRDATLETTNEDGTTVEIQFHLKPYYAIKTGNLQVSKDSDGNKLLNLIENNNFYKPFEINNFNIGERMKSNNISFSEEEKQNLINYCRTTNTKIPKSFATLFEIFDEDIIDIKKMFNADFTYDLERTLGKTNKDINDKLLRLDKILFGIANSYLANKEIDRIMKFYDTKK